MSTVHLNDGGLEFRGYPDPVGAPNGQPSYVVRMAAPGRRSVSFGLERHEVDAIRSALSEWLTETQPDPDRDLPRREIGSRAVVTGDEGKWGHDSAPGDVVEIVGDDVSLAYEPITSAGDFRHVEDGTPDPSPTFAVGDKVRILSDGADDGLRHYLLVGSVAEVDAVYVDGAVHVRGEDQNTGRRIGQTVKLATIEKVEPDPAPRPLQPGDRVIRVSDVQHFDGRAWDGRPESHKGSIGTP